MNNESPATSCCITSRRRRASHVSSRGKIGILVVISFLVLWTDLAKGDEIHKAAGDGDVQKVAAILQANPNLVAAKYDTNEVDDAEYEHVGLKTKGETPLHFAARNGHVEVVKLLLAKGADVNARRDDGWTPLHLAARYDRGEVASMLLANGANVDARDEVGETPLIKAAEFDHQELAKLLLANKADLEGSDNSGSTPLLAASVSGSAGVMALLIGRGANINVRNQQGQTPLLWACANGSSSVAAALLARGADIDVKDDQGQTPFFWACEKRLPDIAALLYQRELIHQRNLRRVSLIVLVSAGALAFGFFAFRWKSFRTKGTLPNNKSIWVTSSIFVLSAFLAIFFLCRPEHGLLFAASPRSWTSAYTYYFGWQPSQRDAAEKGGANDIQIIADFGGVGRNDADRENKGLAYCTTQTLPGKVAHNLWYMEFFGMIAAYSFLLLILRITIFPPKR